VGKQRTTLLGRCRWARREGILRKTSPARWNGPRKRDLKFQRSIEVTDGAS
jgi:hypothetical protein